MLRFAYLAVQPPGLLLQRFNLPEERAYLIQQLGLPLLKLRDHVRVIPLVLFQGEPRIGPRAINRAQLGPQLAQLLPDGFLPSLVGLDKGQGKISRSKTPSEKSDEPSVAPRVGWEMVTFPDLCAIGGGATPSKSKGAYWNGKLPWVSPKDMKVERISDAQDHVSELALEESKHSTCTVADYVDV
ncbi:hypothetical protein AYM40_37740 (plasmid) [Paraburkholderia phytofirmans OLGA172]|uniref:Uncharacterized protein n=1 Tax=Paraburkholderia phytofirmans OLGA172 TaxID=1417228 RepID=A0A167WSG7_9BURK|nr:hypothetical protein AYM40_37740 [Paraburkholderia phytofirmans OLGA172]